MIDFSEFLNIITQKMQNNKTKDKKLFLLVLINYIGKKSMIINLIIYISMFIKIYIFL